MVDHWMLLHSTVMETPKSKLMSRNFDEHYKAFLVRFAQSNEIAATGRALATFPLILSCLGASSGCSGLIWSLTSSASIGII